MIISKLLTKTQAAKALNKYKAFSSPIKVTELAYCAAVNGDLQPALDQHHKWCLADDSALKLTRGAFYGTEEYWRSVAIKHLRLVRTIRNHTTRSKAEL
mgnify:CR=1 FL=1